MFALFSANSVALGDIGRAKGLFRWINAIAHRLRDNAPGQARQNIAAHYDLGNDFYSAWLDETMTYSSARFGSPQESLEAAQLRKVQTLLDRLDLKPGQRLLDIGCGWGTLAIEAARRGASVVGLTLSTEQKAWADRKIAEAGLADRIEIRLQDYRDTAEAFDAVSSVEMVEAVGRRWWGAYLDCIARNLKPGGCAALQFISIDHRIFGRYAQSADFIQTYIFPGGMLLDEPQFEALARERGLLWRERVGFGLDYAETLKRWRNRYNEAVAAGRLTGFERALPQPLALLSHVLRRRLSRHRNRRCAGHDGEGLIVPGGRVSSTGLESLAGLTRARHRGNVAPSNSKLAKVLRLA